VAGATKVVAMTDPQAGDVLNVVTALGPAKGMPSRRDYAQAAVLPSVQGLAVESHIEDLAVSRDGDIVHIGRKTGLALSPSFATEETARLTIDAPKPASMPALIDYQDWPKTGDKGFLARYHHLLDAAAIESAKRLVDIEPYDSDVQQLLLALLLKRGRRGEAMRRFDFYRRRLEIGFGGRPDFDLRSLAAGVVAGAS